MFKAILNRVDVVLTLELEGPLLVKERSPLEDDPNGVSARNQRKERYGEPDMLFVRVAHHHDDGSFRLLPCIPGSSLKGTLRSHAERIARTVFEKGCCDPFGDGEDPWGGKGIFGKSCSLRLDEKYGGRNPGGQVSYRESCPVCRLFGNSFLRGRLRVDDAYPVEKTDIFPQPPGPLEDEAGSTSPWWWSEKARAPLSGTQSANGYLGMRTSVAIDRFTGGALPHALFSYECLDKGSFRTIVQVENYELWQLGLLAFLFRDLREGRLRLGYGKNRGLGSVRARVEEVSVTYYGRKTPPANVFWGVGEMVSEKEASGYGIRQPDSLEIEIISAEEKEDDAYHKTYLYKPEDFESVWRKTADLWVSYIKDINNHAWLNSQE